MDNQNISVNVLQAGAQSMAGLDLSTCYSHAFELYSKQNELRALENKVQGEEARASAQSMQNNGDDEYEFYTAQGGSQIGQGSAAAGGTVAGQTIEYRGAKEAAPINARAEEAAKYESHANKLLLEGNPSASVVATEAPQDPATLTANRQARQAKIQNTNDVLGERFDATGLDRTMDRGEVELLRTNSGRCAKDSRKRAESIQAQASQRAKFFAEIGQASGIYSTAGGSLASAMAKEKAANDNAFAELNRGSSQQADSANRATEANQQAALELTKAVIATQAALANSQRA